MEQDQVCSPGGREEQPPGPGEQTAIEQKGLELAESPVKIGSDAHA
jgi:hypothetical protein